MVDRDFLARMRDGALLVNAARGAVVVTDDLLAELESGRLHAALDVTDPEPLPARPPALERPEPAADAPRRRKCARVAGARLRTRARSDRPLRGGRAADQRGRRRLLIVRGAASRATPRAPCSLSGRDLRRSPSQATSTERPSAASSPSERKICWVEREARAADRLDPQCHVDEAVVERDLVAVIELDPRHHERVLLMASAGWRSAPSAPPRAARGRRPG